MLKTIYALFAVWLLLVTFTQRNINAAVAYDTMTIRGLVTDVSNLQTNEITKANERNKK